MALVIHGHWYFALTAPNVPSRAMPKPLSLRRHDRRDLLPSIRSDRSTLIKFVASSSPLGSWPRNRPHLAAQTTAQSFKLKLPLRLLHKTEVVCADVQPLNQSIPFEFTALLASPSAARRTAHLIQSSTAFCVFSAAGGTSPEQSKQVTGGALLLLLAC